MSIRGNGGGSGGGGNGSDGGSGKVKNGGVWGGFIVEGYGLFSSVVCSLVVNITAFVFYRSHFLFPLMYFCFSES